MSKWNRESSVSCWLDDDPDQNAPTSFPISRRFPRTVIDQSRSWEIGCENGALNWSSSTPGQWIRRQNERDCPGRGWPDRCNGIYIEGGWRDIDSSKSMDRLNFSREWKYHPPAWSAHCMHDLLARSKGCDRLSEDAYGEMDSELTWNAARSIPREYPDGGSETTDRIAQTSLASPWTRVLNGSRGNSALGFQPPPGWKELHFS